MPNVGNIALGKNIGKSSFLGRHIWVACECGCGRERWVRLWKYRKGNLRYCKGHSPNAGRFPNLLGVPGRKRNSQGYILIKLRPEDFFYPMAHKSGYVMEHRLLVAKSIGRLLTVQEKVHHKNGIKDNNVNSNLKLVSQADHSLYTQLCSHCELRKEIRLLRLQIKELIGQSQGRLV